MINLYTNKKLVSDKLISNIDEYFNSWVFKYGLKDSDNIYLSVIDESKLMNNQVNVILTPFGVASYEDISTGCKTLILLDRFGAEKVIDVTESGDNVIRYILDNFDEVSLYSKIPKPLPPRCEKVLLNGKLQVSNLKDIDEYYIDRGMI